MPGCTECGAEQGLLHNQDCSRAGGVVGLTEKVPVLGGPFVQPRCTQCGRRLREPHVTGCVYQGVVTEAQSQ